MTAAAPSTGPRPIFTYQTRLALSSAQGEALDAYAALYGRVERTLFASLRAGGAVNDLKRAFLPRFGITARQLSMPVVISPNWAE